MKLYMFDTETGFYLGQDFGDKADVNISEGVTELAPPACHQGETPLYDFKKRQWSVIEIDNVRSLLNHGSSKGLQ